MVMTAEDSSNNGRFTELLMSEIKQLREDARKARQERNTLAQSLDHVQHQADSNMQLLNAELKHKEA